MGERLQHTRSVTAGAVISAALAITLGMLPVFLVGGLVPFIRSDFPVSSGQLGGVVGFFFGASAIGAIAGGQLARRFASAPLLRVCAMASIAVSVPVAAFANSVLVLGAGVGAAGILNGIMQPAVNLVLRAHLRPARLGRAMGVKQAAGPGAALPVGLAIPAIAATVGWRWSYALVPVVAILMFAIMPASRRRMVDSGEGGGHPRADRLTLILLAAGAGCGTGAAFTAAAFLVQTMAGRGMSVESAGLTLAFVSMVNICVLIVSGELADRRPTIRRPMTIAAMYMVGGLGYALVAASQGVAGGIIGATLAIPIGWGWHVLLHLIVMDGRVGDPGPATGAVMSGVFTGGLLVPLLYGSLEQTAGTAVAWSLLTGIALAGTITMLLTERRQRTVALSRAAHVARHQRP